MKSIKKKVSKILMSLTMVFAMLLAIMPTNVFAAGTPSATISDVTVSGYTNVEIPRFTTPYSATITLKNAEFMFWGNEDVTPYCEGVPPGITVNLQTVSGSDITTGTLTFYGTPTAVTSGPIKMTLPGDQDPSIIYPFGEDITVTVNLNAKWNIEKNNLDDAKPLAETAITNITATNDTEATDILDTVNNSISTVSDVSATWKAEPTIVAATKNAVGSIQGTIILTYKSLTTEVVVNKTIAKLPKTDKEKIDEAKTLAESAITAITATNSTIAGNILDAVTTAISPVDGVTASWKTEPTVTLATKDNAGSITGTIVLTCGSETVEVEVNKTIAKLPITDKDKVDEAKPLAQSAVTAITATNSTIAGNILDAVTTAISPVDGVTASWKTEPTVTLATKDNAGSITGTIVLTCGSETVEVEVNKTIAKLPITDKDKVDEAKPLAQSAITAITATNSTIAGNILDAVTTAISPVDGVTASWKTEPTVTLATKDNAGSITGTIVLTCGSETVEVEVNKTIAKLPITDKDKVDEAKTLAESAITAITATNSTTAGNILDAVTTAISPVDGVTASWKTKPTVTLATKDNAGSITGTIILTCGSETVEVEVNKTIAQLPAPTPDRPTITVGNSGSNHQINNGKDMTFTCSGKLEDLTGVYIDGKLVDESNYTLLSGSTILTLKASYLDTLSAGKHTLKFQYKDNVSAETDFTIIAKSGVTPPKPSSPQTGDTSNTMFYFGLIISSGCIAGFGIKKKKSLIK